MVIRGIWRGELWWACPQYVVQDTPDRLAVYWRAGTPVRRWVHRPTVFDMLIPQVCLMDDHWTDTDVLSLVTPGAGHSVDIMWEAGKHTQRCWYVHLQEPLRRTPVGFDTMDQILDIVISPDRKRWFWKDEDEFRQAESIGVYSHAEACAIREEGERVIAQLYTGSSPFDEGWETWTPPVDWDIPHFPDGWDTVPII